jgi:hypothetical protein
LWGIAELQVNKCFHNTTDSLVQKRKEVIDSINRDTVVRACKHYRSRIKAVVQDGSYFIK